MNLLQETGGSRLYTFHSHTQFCDGRAAMEAFVPAAVAAGFTHYGFSPHSPVPIVSPCNMHRDNVDVYLAEVRRLQELWGDRIRLYASMEIDYLDESWGPSHEYFRNLPLDYRIGSVHFIPSDDGPVDIDGRFESFARKMKDHFHGDIRYVVETFYRQSVAMVEAGGFDMIGHFDKVGHNASHYMPGVEDEPWYRKGVDDLIDCIVASGVTVELNTKAWKDHGRMFPGQRYMTRLLKAGVPIVVNSDAHVPALINAGRAEGFAMLDKARAAMHD